MIKKRFTLNLTLFFLFLNSICLSAEFKKIQPQFRHHNISEKKLISSANYDLISPDHSLARMRSFRPDTITVLAIRVDFVEDNSRFTTGTGKFDYSDDETYFINPPPHDKNYFQQQLKALSNYFKKVSNGKLVIKADVYPEGSQVSYSLDKPMTYYNPNTSEDELDQRLSELMRDSFLAADHDGNIDFLKYDAFIIFHAGVGADFIFDLESTPNDIPSVFLNFTDLKNTIGKDDPSFQGIQVRNNTITEAIILPETQSQMGYDIGLLGTICIMFGHQIGLPNLYDSDTGWPGIGVFGLMDQGSANFLGLLPAQPSAWSKVFLGWVEPVVLSSATNIPVATGVAADPYKIYKIPISAREYYLIENRQRHALRNVETTVGYDEHDVRIEFKIRDDGVNELTPSSTDVKIGVIVDVEEYDFGLPGSGILIWHIDESVIEAHYKENRVNTDINHRGVDLVEADGAQDIGHFYNFFGIQGYESGSRWDMWWDANDANKQINQSSLVEFTPGTIPASRSHSKANTHVVIKNFSEPDSIMTFDLTFDLYANNFPVQIGAMASSNSVLAGDMKGDKSEELILCSADGSVFAWDSQGNAIIDNGDSLTLTDLKGDLYKINLAIFAKLDEPISFTPALGNLDEDAYLELVLITDKGSLCIYDAMDADSDGRADLRKSYQSLETPSTNPVVARFDNVPHIIIGYSSGLITAFNADAEPVWQYLDLKSHVTGIAIMDKYTDPQIVVSTANGDIVILAANGDRIASIRMASDVLKSPVVGDLDNDQDEEIVVNDVVGNFFIFEPSTQLSRQFNLPEKVDDISNSVIADINDDGFLEIIAQARGKVFAFNYNGVLLDNFPVTITRADGDTYSEPLIADLDDDGTYEIILASVHGDIYALNSIGQAASGYPVPISSGIHNTPVLGDFNQDGRLDMAFTGSDGFIYNLNLGSVLRQGSVLWSGFRNDVEHSGKVTIYPEANPGETGLMPASSVYNYPNPTEGNSTTIRYYLGESADINIRIYDIAGELVAKLEAIGTANIHNEIVVDLTDLQSGVYLTRVEAKGVSGSSVAFFKMAVVK